ncbi:hypothetical protein LCGC14_3018820 [marine sediment metagenome]|uniref:Uncharacterized protein n=1 Tax=marine sediment metagenome TaxID=412755 RepID=A0A0F8WVW6_9ZZZZ
MKLVKIEWVDSRTPTDGWEHLNKLNDIKACECVSVGFLLKSGDDVKALAPNLADIDEDSDVQASAIIIIPVCSITRMVELAEELAP